MKTSKIFAVAALSFAAFAGVAQAEEYQGVTESVSALSRAEVQQQAVAAAHAANQNVPSSAIPMGSLAQSRDRALVQAEAVAAAHDSTQNLRRESFAGSQIPAHLQPQGQAAQQAAR
ncbi:alpha/beta hydrolase [Xenophilus sp. Marseille-Q4582]|uniref:alpha/beta hydrolase n=1 Tax=Xenophilus sp. Marseille-Q4582 TaxID=2866600 RepID=UPI001CE42B12|nr:alpha/beta hydrolase [Xenophilus sp. Marseille-Q4582]